jgi:phage head maturation protease
VSVGFKPIDNPTYNKENGLDYGAVELLEISAVPVPANPDALRKALASHNGGEVTETRARQIEQAVDRAGLAGEVAQ